MTTREEENPGLRETLLRALDESHSKNAWHGPNLKVALKGLTPEEAAWRPNPERHNIWEILLHTAYWTHIVSRRVTGEASSFPEKGKDWFPRPRELSESALQEDLALLEAQHRHLREIVQDLPATALLEPVKTGKGTVFDNALGIAFHHVYHAGQIRLLKKLRESR